MWLAAAALFALCAAAQYGGRERLAWLGVYGAAALLAAGAAFGFVLWRAAAVLAVVAAAWSTAVFSRASATGGWLGQDGRDALGLALVAFAMLAICWGRLRAAREARARREGEVSGAGEADRLDRRGSFADLATKRFGERRGGGPASGDDE